MFNFLIYIYYLASSITNSLVAHDIKIKSVTWETTVAKSLVVYNFILNQP